MTVAVALGKANDAAKTTHNLVGQRLGRKGQETRDRIIAAMERLVAAEDDGPITLSAVAREASLGMSSLYLYFPDLGELVLAVLQRELKETAPATASYLAAFWDDEELAERTQVFTRQYFAYWKQHARLLQLRNSFADARDMRFIRFRLTMSSPVRAMLVRQMCAEPGACDPVFEDCATVMLTGLERVATIVINPDFTMLAGITSRTALARYVERLAVAEARMIELLIRDMRAQARSGASPGPA